LAATWVGAFSQNCTGENKQTAIYAHWNYSTPLDETPAFDLNSTVVFTDTSHIPAAAGGVFGSHMIRWGLGSGARGSSAAIGGGYTGFQAYGPSSPGAQLFSVWDGSVDKQRMLAWPAAPNCRRHLNDGTGMGTQCSSNATFPDGHRVLFHVRRTLANATIQVNASFSVRGDVWASTVTDLTANAAPLAVGAILLQGGWGGIESFSFFFEHVSCVPCHAWPASVAIVDGPTLDGRATTSAYATINENSCKAQTVTDCLEGVGCGAPIVHILTGPGVVRNISNGQQIW
jgi:hypothetical protein